ARRRLISRSQHPAPAAGPRHGPELDLRPLRIAGGIGLDAARRRPVGAMIAPPDEDELRAIPGKPELAELLSVVAGEGRELLGLPAGTRGAPDVPDAVVVEHPGDPVAGGGGYELSREREGDEAVDRVGSGLGRQRT